MDDHLTYLKLNSNLQLQAKSINRPDTNQVYGISNTTYKNIWASRSLSTLETLQSGSNQQLLVIKAIIREQVQVETTQLRTQTTKLKDKFIVIKQPLTTLTGTCAPPRYPSSSDKDQPLPSSPAFVTKINKLYLIIFFYINNTNFLFYFNLILFYFFNFIVLFYLFFK